MNDLSITFIVGAGEKRQSLVADKLAVSEIIREVALAANLPLVGFDSQPVEYRLNSSVLGRMLKPEETLAGAGVLSSDTLTLTASLTAGSSVAESPRMRRLRADYQRMVELDARSDVID